MEAGTFGHYRLKRLLGRGGMGEVWLAYDDSAERTVALKVLRTDFTTDADYRRRFEREAELGTRLHDPHLVPIHGFGEHDGRLYLAMAYIDGIDLARTLARDGAQPPEIALGHLTRVASGLDAMHRAGLIHRDVKPANILIDRTGHAYLIDFGTARATDETTFTATGSAIGTLAYMAPERFSGTVDARSDIYSLACVLYECLTGRRPFGDPQPAELMHAHLVREPPRPSAVNPAVPTALDAIVAHGMAKDPARRYASAAEFAATADAALTLARAKPARDTSTASASTVIVPGAGPAPARVETTSAPAPTRIETTSAPAPTRIETTSAPAPTRIETTSAPAPTRTEATVGPTPTRAATGSAPDTFTRWPGTEPDRTATWKLAAGISAAIVVLIGALLIGTALRGGGPLGTTAPLGAPGGAEPGASTTDRPSARTLVLPTLILPTFGPATPTSSTPPPPPGTAVRGSGVGGNEFEYTVTDVRTGIRTIDGYTTGGSFVSVTLRVTNLDWKQQWFAGAVTKLYDTAGNQYGVYYRGSTDFTERLDPGATHTTTLVFEIAPDVVPSHLDTGNGITLGLR
ncbi:protein kinase [Nocardia sp. 2]|uniref:non-specific serine/threonine protein kinase n=1 Tax=Nocardia acididurans TaxID=2802282 RepID=A0ABS1M353_9NOCA|nr:serine/threonine-protein kinase [Nocardia acididurans]MBL1074966.1 protein kinase [Nocardia acididurans]